MCFIFNLEYIILVYFLCEVNEGEGIDERKKDIELPENKSHLSLKKFFLLIF